MGLKDEVVIEPTGTVFIANVLVLMVKNVAVVPII
jgi:hypothetical protein